MSITTASYIILDETTALGENHHELVWIVRAGDHKLRVEVWCDFYETQSYARADVLNSGLTWTPLVHSPPADWYSSTALRVRTRPDGKDSLTGCAEALLQRALTVLA